MKNKALIIIIPVVVALLLAFGGVYTVDEREQVVVTQFGRAIGEPKREPGLYFKIPFIQNANRFPKSLRWIKLSSGWTLSPDGRL